MLRRRAWWPRPAVAALFVGAVSLGAWSYWRPAPPLGLRAIEEPDGLLIRWSPDAEALRTARYGVLEIRDGSRRAALHLDPQQLREGRVQYRREADVVELRLRIWRYWGIPAEESLVYWGETAATKREAEQAAALREALAERDELAATLERVQKELRAQRARTAQLEQVNRILRQRLEVESARPR